MSNPTFLVAPALPSAPPRHSVCRRRRRTLLLPASCASATKSAAAHTTAESSQSIVLPVPPPRAPAPAPTPPALPPNLLVRPASRTELYSVADVRCEAFYDSPVDTPYHPVRRREIYQAMQARVASGTHCVVAVDIDPPPHWRAFAPDDFSGLVVGSLDVSLHRMDTGKRRAFDVPGPGDVAALAYVSSMAVRPCWKRRGLARALLSFTDDTLRAMGFDEVFLHVDEENDAAVRLYDSCGFQKVRNPMPEWVHALAKEEHTLMVKRYDTTK